MNSSRSSFTEAVPLSLSSMAHMAIPLTGGLLDGLKEVIQHTMLASVNYARQTIAPGQWAFGDVHLSHDPLHGKLVQMNNKEKLPTQLQKLGFKHEYIQEAFLFLGPPALVAGDWKANNLILGRIVLHFTCKDYLTEEELDADEEAEDEMPETVLFKAEVEYRSLPPTGNQEAIEAEELSMLSFGYSIDDDVKYGALAALYDKHAKYVLEVFSVRGKKYKFDLMNATLSNGHVPRWNSDHSSEDPFAKSLCVTVTDQADKQSTTRLVLSLDGNLRVPVEGVPNFHYYANELKNSFLWSAVAILAIPSRQALLLEEKYIDKVHVHGKYVTKWGTDGKIGSHAPALFGMDLHSIPIWHGRIVDYECLKQAYSIIWQEVLIDARLLDWNLAGRLLWRLMYGKDDGGYDDDEDLVDTSMDCLESQLMSSSKYDPVGICAKALATKFQQEFGKAAFPCTQLEVDVIKRYLGHRSPVVAPVRLISILRRGGYFDWKRTMEELWFTDEVRPARNEAENKLVNTVVGKLSHHMELAEAHVLFVKIDDKDPIAHRNMCRYHGALKQFHVNDKVLSMEKCEFWLGYYICEEYSAASLRDYLEGGR
jgi:hypothetical protein